jgi:phospholipid transport system substrate-binding protein
VAWAGAPTDAMRDFFGAANVVLNDARTEDQPLDRLRAIRRHVDDVFDFREAAMLALGREWSGHTALEQNEFVALFADLLERSFVWRVAGKAALGGGVKVQYVGETVEGDTATVETAVAARDGSDLRLDYRMVWRAERWVVRDVVMDGVSTMENYHAQFQRVVRDSSWRDLMSQLRAKVGSPAVQVASGPAPTPVPRPATLLMGPPAAPDLDRAIPEERQAIARDVAAVVTPGLAVADVPPLPVLRQPPLPAAERRVVPAPPPIESAPTVTPPPVSPVAALGAVEPPRTSRAVDTERVGVVEPPRARQVVAIAPPPRAAVPVAAVQRPRALKPVVARPVGTTPVYWVQVGAFRNATTAGRVAERVKGEILVVPSPSAGEPLLRVRVGPFASRAQAASRLRDFQALGYQPFIAADR